jgi:hypothetical protein
MKTDNPIINEFINQLTPGKVIDLQLGGQSFVRVKPTIIGIDSGRYILIKFPNNLNTADYKDVLMSGGGVIVRYILEGLNGECVAFSTTIQHVLNKPERLIFLNYPTHIENRQLRTQQREKTHLPALISPNKINDTSTDQGIAGYIVDISAQGCQFSFKPSAGKGGIKKCPIQIAITIVGKEAPCIINAHVKNNRSESGQILVGILFDKSSLERVAMLLDDMAIGSININNPA